MLTCAGAFKLRAEVMTQLWSSCVRVPVLVEAFRPWASAGVFRPWAWGSIAVSDAVLQHALRARRQPSRGGAGRALHKVAFDDVLANQEAGHEHGEEVGGEGGSGQGPAPEPSRHRLLVEELPDWRVQEEHREGKRAETGYRRGPQHPREDMRTVRLAVAVQRRKELRVERHEKSAAHDTVVEVPRRCPQEQRAVGSGEVHEGVLPLPPIGLSVQHDIPGRRDAGGHLEKGPEGMQARHVPDERILSVRGRDVARTEPRGLRV
mmetsp:Transcript_121562/g.350924  ORF Transcript_121562/g.350924 Transcript_121562/m.350924 type:complete len:263 (+) Transcript_121562:103-891(+)